MRKFGEYNISPQVVMANASIRADLASLGYQEFPVVMVKDSDGKTIDSWSGFQPAKIEASFERE